MSLISLIPKWSGSETAVPLEEFISSLEGAVRVGRWQECDTLEVAPLKITDSAKIFYNGCPELQAKDNIANIQERFQETVKKCSH
jgi:hypothetical protein